MVKKYDREKISRQILSKINAGLNTSSEIARSLKLSHGTVSHFINILVDEHTLFPRKVGRKIYYSTFAPDAPKAHDPFGLCYGKIKQRNDEVSPSH